MFSQTHFGSVLCFLFLFFYFLWRINAKGLALTSSLYTKRGNLCFFPSRDKVGKRWLVKHMALQCMLNHLPRGRRLVENKYRDQNSPISKYSLMQQTSCHHSALESKSTPSQDAEYNLFQCWVLASFSCVFFLDFGLNCIDCIWLHTVNSHYSWWLCSTKLPWTLN